MRVRGVSSLVVVLVFAASAAAIPVRAGTQPSSKEQTASAFYMGYLAALAKAKSIDDLRPWMAKENLVKIDATSASDKPMFFNLMQSMTGDLKDIKVVKETKKGNGVELELSATSGMDGGKMKGIVSIVREGDAWKVGKESWSSAK